MTRDQNDPSNSCEPNGTSARAKSLTPQARRALDEAAQRRKDQDARMAADGAPAEFGGRKGPDPARYGDWEKKGIASDF